jgi:hypothetical protein
LLSCFCSCPNALPRGSPSTFSPHRHLKEHNFRSQVIPAFVTHDVPSLH